MLTAAFVGWSSPPSRRTLLGTGTPTPSSASPCRWSSGCVAAIAAGMLISLLHAWLAISVRIDQIISGTIINIGALGLTGYLNSLIASQSLAGAGSFSLSGPAGDRRPADRRLAPQRGPQPGPASAISPIVIVMVLQIMLFRSRWGLRTRAVGEHPRRPRRSASTSSGCATATSWPAVRWPRLGGACLSHGEHQHLPGRHDPGPRLHRTGGDDRRALDADRRVRRGAALRLGHEASASPSRSRRPTGDLGDLMTTCRASSARRCRTSSRSSCWPASSVAASPPAADGQPYEREAHLTFEPARAASQPVQPCRREPRTAARRRHRGPGHRHAPRPAPRARSSSIATPALTTRSPSCWRCLGRSWTCWPSPPLPAMPRSSARLATRCAS